VPLLMLLMLPGLPLVELILDVAVAKAVFVVVLALPRAAAVMPNAQ